MSVSEFDLLEQQTLKVLQLEKELVTLRGSAKIVEHDLPVMRAFVGSEERYQSHDGAFRRWLGLSAHQIDGQAVQKCWVRAPVPAWGSPQAGARGKRRELRTHTGLR